jgi:hypothetical protein
LSKRTAEMDATSKGEDHEDTLESMFGVMTSLRFLERWDECLELARTLMEKLVRVLGREHALTLMTMDIMGNAMAGL